MDSAYEKRLDKSLLHAFLTVIYTVPILLACLGLHTATIYCCKKGIWHHYTPVLTDVGFLFSVTILLLLSFMFLLLVRETIFHLFIFFFKKRITVKKEIDNGNQ